MQNILKSFFLISKRNSFVFLLLYGLILFIPEPMLINAPGIRGLLVSLFFNVLFSLTFAWLICVIGELLNIVSVFLFYFWHFFWHITILLYATSEVFLVSVFNLQWNAFTFQLVNETNINEALGFIKTYSSFGLIFLILVFVVAILLIEYYAIHKSNSCIKDYKSLLPLKCTFIALFILLLLVEGKCFSFDAWANYSKSDKLIRREGLWNIYQSILIYNADKELLQICSKSQENIVVDSCNFISNNIVLIIGETFNKHHSSIYGYNLETNSLCSKLDRIVFNDVITPINATTTAFKYFLSFSEVGGNIRWCDTPLFPAIFKTVGYNVIFYSNQFVVEGDLNLFDASAGFFNHPSVYNRLFSNRNHHRYGFDMELIDEYEMKRNQIEKDSLNMIIFHLQGQHAPAVERYPKELEKFTVNDINRPDLSDSEKQYIADYDNATLYNDAVVAKIVEMFETKDAIIIYFADHGEEVYDFRNKAGRFHDFKETGPNGLRNQLDVPLIIFPTRQYKKRHPDICASIENSVNKPFMTDYLPHLLLWLGGIECEWYDSSKNLFSDEYNLDRHRLVDGTTIDYDEICRQSLK